MYLFLEGNKKAFRIVKKGVSVENSVDEEVLKEWKTPFLYRMLQNQYSRSQKSNNQLFLTSLVLQRKGLSQSGQDLLRAMKNAPCTRTVQRQLKSRLPLFSERQLAKIRDNVTFVWIDNYAKVCRHSNLKSGGFSVNTWTSVGVNILSERQSEVSSASLTITNTCLFSV